MQLDLNKIDRLLQMDPRARPNNEGMSTASVDDFKGEIFQLYIVEKKTLKEIMAKMQEAYGITAT